MRGDAQLHLPRSRVRNILWVRVTVPPYRPSTTTHTPFALLQESITSSFLFFFLFMKQFTLPCSQPATLASKEGEWGEAWALCTSVILKLPLHPLSLSREYWVSSPCSPCCRQSCTEEAEPEHWWEQSWGGGRGRGTSPSYSCLTRYWPWQCVVSLTYQVYSVRIPS